MLSADEHRRIEAAIREAERHTAGEIVVVIARQASRYRLVPFLYGLVAALIAPWPLAAWTELSLTRVLLAQLAVAVVVVAALSWPVLRFRLTPRWLQRARARDAAEHEFRSRGLADTRGRTGLLLYLAQAERHAEVIGDLAVAARVEEGAWRAIIEVLVGAIRRGDVADGLVGAVERMGGILAEHVPVEAGDADELPNRVVVL